MKNLEIPDDSNYFVFQHIDFLQYTPDIISGYLCTNPLSWTGEGRERSKSETLYFMNPFNPRLVKRSRKLRKTSTPGEIYLWKYLSKKQMYGYKFRRQHAMLNYIIDFYCIPLRLAIEIDGSSHDENKFDYDQKRQKELESVGVNFLRFSEYEVRRNIHNVLQTIENFILERN